MATTYTWLNTSTGEDWTIQADWNPASPVGGPVTGDTVIFDGNETAYTGDADVSLPSNNSPVGTFHVNITGNYYTSSSGIDTTLGVAIGTLTVDGATAGCILPQTATTLVLNNGAAVIDAVTAGAIIIPTVTLQNNSTITNENFNFSCTTLTLDDSTFGNANAIDLTISGLTTISSAGSMYLSATGNITLDSVTSSGAGEITCSIGDVIITNALTMTASTLQVDTGASLELGSFICNAGNTIVMDGTADMTCTGNFNIANNTMIWTTVAFGDILLIDGNASISLGGGDAGLTLTIDADVIMLAIEDVNTLELAVSATLDGGDFGFNIYKDVTTEFTGYWTNRGVINIKGDCTWDCADIVTHSGFVTIDAGVTIDKLDTCFSMEGLIIESGAYIIGTGSTTSAVIAPVDNDFCDVSGAVDGLLMIQMAIDLSNSYDILLNDNNLRISGNSVLTQLGNLTCNELYLQYQNVADVVSLIVSNGCDIKNIIIGHVGGAPFGLSGAKLTLNGTCYISSIVQGNVINVGDALAFDSSKVYMTSGTIDGTGIEITNTHAIIYDSTISNVDASNTETLWAIGSTDSGNNHNIIFSEDVISGVMNPVDYKIIADYYAAARNKEVLTNGDLFDAVYYVVSLSDLAPEIDLLSEYWNTYLITANSIETPSGLMPAVQALNNHVVVRGSYEDINEYFADNIGLEIDATWQSLSEDAGYDISDTYVG